MWMPPTSRHITHTHHHHTLWFPWNSFNYTRLRVHSSTCIHHKLIYPSKSYFKQYGQLFFFIFCIVIIRPIKRPCSLFDYERSYIIALYLSREYCEFVLCDLQFMEFRFRVIRMFFLSCFQNIFVNLIGCFCVKRTETNVNYPQKSRLNHFHSLQLKSNRLLLSIKNLTSSSNPTSNIKVPKNTYW